MTAAPKKKVTTLEVPEQKPETRAVLISAPEMQIIVPELIGFTALGINRFSEETQEAILEKQKSGSPAKTKTNHEAKNVDKLFHASYYRNSPDGWYGIPCVCLRNAMVAVCRIAEYKMTHARYAFQVLPDGYDYRDKRPLMRIYGDPPEMWQAYAKPQRGGVDIRIRSIWEKWSLRPKVRFDATIFTVRDIINLIARVGDQGGLGEGRPASPKSSGLGMGLFTIKGGPSEVRS